MKKAIIATLVVLMLATAAFAGFPGMYAKDGVLSSDISGVTNETSVTATGNSVEIGLDPNVVIANSLTVSAEGIVNANVFILNSPRWEDETLPGTLGQPGASAPDFEIGGGAPLAGMGNAVGAFCFDKTTDQELYFDTKLHHAYKEESNLVIEAHWFPVDSGAGTVQWVAEWDWVNVNTAFPAASSFFNVGAPASGTAFQHQHVDINGDLDGTGKVLGSAIMIHFFRDANGTHGTDDYDDDACLIQLVIHYQVDTPGGSTNIDSK